MKRFLKPLSIISFLVVLGVTLFIVRSVKGLNSDDPDYVAITNTLTLYAKYRAEADYTLDDSLLAQVVANDPRGGLLSDVQVKAVRYMKQIPELSKESIGYLDMWQARYAFDRRVRDIYNDTISKGIMPTPTVEPPTDNPVPLELKGTKFDRFANPPKINPNDIPEIKALVRATGYGGAMLPPQKMRTPYPFVIKSIKVQDDLAYAEVDWSYALVQDILVKRDGVWYLIGEKPVQSHSN